MKINRADIFVTLFLLTTAAIVSCGGATSKETQSPVVESLPPTTDSRHGLGFNADSAYTFIAEQLTFGTRVPGTVGHDKCSRYIEQRLQQFGADTVITTKAVVKAFNGDRLPIANIFARFSPEKDNRILLVAHYDTRPWADNDNNPSNRLKPIPGANDGASGVAVMLELARLIGQLDEAPAVDMLFTDAEDYGDPEGLSGEESWCLGTQHFADNLPYDRRNLPEFGIVLDMVGGVNARFYREYYSERNARRFVDRVWAAAARAGFNDVFVNEISSPIVDDHLFISRAGIPCIDIVENNNAATGTFPPTWHSLNDDLSSIDRSSLRAVGATVLDVLFAQKSKPSKQ